MTQDDKLANSPDHAIAMALRQTMSALTDLGEIIGKGGFLSDEDRNDLIITQFQIGLLLNRSLQQKAA